MPQDNNEPPDRATIVSMILSTVVVLLFIAFFVWFIFTGPTPESHKQHWYSASKPPVHSMQD